MPAEISILRLPAKCDSIIGHLSPGLMDRKKLAALARRNAAKSAAAQSGNVPKNFGKKYDGTLKDVPKDEASLKKQQESDRFFAEMKKRDF